MQGDLLPLSVSAFNNLGVLFLLQVAWDFWDFAVLGSHSWRHCGSSAHADEPWLLLQTLPAFPSLGPGVMS